MFGCDRRSDDALVTACAVPRTRQTGALMPNGEVHISASTSAAAATALGSDSQGSPCRMLAPSARQSCSAQGARCRECQTVVSLWTSSLIIE
jgi:hypothetical protein